MSKNLYESLRGMLLADKKLGRALADGTKGLVDEMEKKQQEFERNKQKIREEIERGSRNTRHRIPL